MRKLILAGAAALLLAGCGGEEPPQGPCVKKLDPQGNTWYIYDCNGWRSYEAIKQVPHTCASIGREVARVELAGKYGSIGTVTCK